MGLVQEVLDLYADEVGLPSLLLSFLAYLLIGQFELFVLLLQVFNFLLENVALFEEVVRISLALDQLLLESCSLGQQLDVVLL